MQVAEQLYSNFVNDFSSTICRITAGKEYSNIIFLCIGTDRITGDSFGPLVGYKLRTLLNDTRRLNVIGDLENTVCANNINRVLREINCKYSNPFIIAIDSALSTPQNIGTIIVSEGGLLLGQGLNKQRVCVGDMNIKGVVAQNLNHPMQNLRLLQNTSLSLVMSMADVVSSGIYNTINYDCDE